MSKTIDTLVRPVIILSSLLAAAALGAFVNYFLRTDKPLTPYVCSRERIKHDDGDSFYCGEEYIRILGLDTPEIAHPEHGIYQDQEYGREAVALTNGILDGAKRVTIIEDKKDKYGRTLAHVLVDGELLAVRVIKAGLGYETISVYGNNGFPEYALQITDAAAVSPPPKFENPHTWRQEHQEKRK